MSPATVQYRSLYKKLFFRHGEIIYFLPELIGPYGIKIGDLLAEIDDQAKPIGSDPVYIKLYRRIKYLAAKHVYKLTFRERVDWEATNKKRMDEVTRGVQAIFAAAVAGDTPPQRFRWNLSDGAKSRRFHCKSEGTGFPRRANRTTVLLVLAGAKFKQPRQRCKGSAKWILLGSAL